MGTSGYAGEPGDFGGSVCGGFGGRGGGGGVGGIGIFVLLVHDGIPPHKIAVRDTDDHLLIILTGGKAGGGDSDGGAGGWWLVEFLPVGVNVDGGCDGDGNPGRVQGKGWGK